jgi:hypothetical protein
MSASCAKRCKIFNLIDSKYAARVSGVGTGEVIGAIKEQSFKIGQLRFGNKLSVLKQSRRDLIIGMDILSRFKSEIDLNQGSVKLKVHGSTVNVPLLEQAKQNANIHRSVAQPQITIQELSGGFYDGDDYEYLNDEVVSMEGI